MSAMALHEQLHIKANSSENIKDSHHQLFVNGSTSNCLSPTEKGQ